MNGNESNVQRAGQPAGDSRAAAIDDLRAWRMLAGAKAVTPADCDAMQARESAFRFDGQSAATPPLRRAKAGAGNLRQPVSKPGKSNPRHSRRPELCRGGQRLICGSWNVGAARRGLRSGDHADSRRARRPKDARQVAKAISRHGRHGMAARPRRFATSRFVRKQIEPAPRRIVLTGVGGVDRRPFSGRTVRTAAWPGS